MISSRRETLYQFLAVAIGVLAVVSLPFCVVLAVASGMMFDPPGSSENVELRWTSRLMVLFPVAVALTAHLAFGAARRPSGRTVTSALAPLTAWFLALGLLAIVF